MIPIEPVTALDRVISEYLAALEQQIRADQCATGPERDEMLDAVPDKDADWNPITVEEILCIERFQIESWRDRIVAVLDRKIA